MNAKVFLRLNGGTKERMLKDYSERMLDQGTAERAYNIFLPWHYFDAFVVDV